MLAARLQDEGAISFTKSWNDLITCIRPHLHALSGSRDSKYRLTARAKPSSSFDAVTNRAFRLHLFAGVAHGDAERTLREHGDVVTAVANHRDLLDRHTSFAIVRTATPLFASG